MRKLIAYSAGVLIAATAPLAASATGGRTYTVGSYASLRGLTVTVPPGWRFHDSHGEVSLQAPDYKPASGIGAFVSLLTDPYGTLSARSPAIESVRTPPALVAFLLHHHPKLSASPAPSRKIAGAAALGVDLRVLPNAGKEDPRCSTACWSYLRFRHGCCIGTDSNTWVRAYFATVGHAENEHVLLVLFEGDPKSAFAKALPTVQKILDSVTLPPSLRSR
jgi:hypothetical protein